MHVHTCTQTHRRITHTHTHTHRHMHARTHTHTHAHTDNCAFTCPRLASEAVVSTIERTVREYNEDFKLLKKE